MRLVSLRAPALLLASAVICTSSARAQFSFQVNRITSNINVSSDGVQVLAVGDFTNDARDDIVAVDNFNDGFCLYINDGTGNFPTAPVEFGTGSGPVAIAVGDFNHDGNLDVATANQDADTITAYLGDGTGNFTNPRDFDVDPSPVALVAVDLNNDRFDDLAVLSGDTVYLLKSNGDGTFTPFSPASLRTRGTGGNSIVSGLFNNDTNADLAITLGDSSQVSVLLGGGDGTFQTPQLQNVGSGPDGLVVAELMTRGTFDIAVVDSDELADQNISLLFGNDMGGFQPDMRTTAETSSIGIAAGDFNQDGAVDLAVTNISGGISVTFLENAPNNPMAENGFVLLASGIGIGQSATAIRTANLNGDGYPDLVVLGLDSSGDPSLIGALVNTSFQTPAATTPPTTPGTATPPTATFTPSGPSPTPTVTNTPRATSTATPLPTVPLSVCNTNESGQPSAGVMPVGVATGRLTDETPFIAVADASNQLIILKANINTSATDPCGRLGLTAAMPTPIAIADPRAVISDTVDPTSGAKVPLDFNRDGKTDLAVIGRDGLSVFLGDGEGGFTREGDPIPAGDPASLASTDYNRDGRPDIVVGDHTGNTTRIFLNTSSRSFASCQEPGFATTVVVGQDLNRDGRPDYALGNGMQISVFVQSTATATALATSTPTASPSPSASATPTSSATPTPSSTTSTPAASSPTPAPTGGPCGQISFVQAAPVGGLQGTLSAMVVGLFDVTDAVPDLAVAFSSTTSSGIRVFLGRLTGTALNYQPRDLLTVPTPAGSSTAAMASALGTTDINGDGRFDLLVTDQENGTLVIFLAQSDGSFSQSLIPQPVETPVGEKKPMPVAMAIADTLDIDKDGKPDIVIANKGDGSISVFLSSVQPATPTPLPTGTPTPTGTATVTPTGSATATDSATPTQTRSPSPLPTNTPKPGTFNLSSCAVDPASGTGPPWWGLIGAAFLMLWRRWWMT
jgi:MYXO-CTERM domain-containing protein